MQAISVEYFDGEEWPKEWNSNDTEGLLPQAVGISLVMQSEDVGPLSFASTVKIVCRANKLGGATVQKATESDKMLQSIDNNKKTDD